MVSARSVVVLMLEALSRVLSFLINLASTFTLATSLTMQPIFNFVFSSKFRSKVVFPAQQLCVLYRSQHLTPNGLQVIERYLRQETH